MTRYLRLTRGGEMMLPTVESCPACTNAAPNIRSYNLPPFTGETAYYECDGCNHQWPVVVGEDS